MPVNRSHQRYVDYLFAQARASRYPSHQVLKRIEAVITDRETAERYVDMLIEWAETQRYPSLRMLDRAYWVVAKMAVADEIERIEAELEHN